jgi:SPOR domain
MKIETHSTSESIPPTEEIERPAGIERSAELERAGGVAVAAVPEQAQFLLCEHCQAPVDRDQRYCVRCGARQSHARNPATSYFAAAARSRRAGAPQQRREGFLRGPAFALFLVLLPLAVAVGVLVGRGGSSNNDKLIAALEKQQPVVASPGSGTSASSVSSGARSGNLPSDFSLPRGYAVKLSTLPMQTTDQSAVGRAEQEARAKGAIQVGLINPKDFKTTPSQGASNYVIYSGQFKTKTDATKALAKLKSKFPSAQVIAVAPVASASAPVVEHTAYGTVHKIAGSRPTAQQIQQDKQVVQKINRTVGKSYVNAQKGLPDTIAVTGSPGASSTPNQSAAEKLGEK